MDSHNNISDTLLIEKYQLDRDQKWLESLYAQYIPLIKGLCLKYLKNNQLAEDAINDIYEKIVIKLQTHKVHNFKSWIYTVSKNHCFEVLRKNAKNRAKKNTAYNMYSETIFHLDNETNDNKIAHLRLCINELKEDQKRVIQQFYYEKKTYYTIAEEHNLTWKKVRSLIQNGRRMLKKCIDEKMRTHG